MAYRTALQEFSVKWRAAIVRWEKEAAPLKGVPVLVQHNAFPYLVQWLYLKEVGTLEPKPGVGAIRQLPRVGAAAGTAAARTGPHGTAPGLPA